jgi:hypothetical protein
MNCSAIKGGAIYITDSILNIDNESEFITNYANQSGGAL